MEVFDHKKVPVDVDLGFAVEETGGALREALQFALSRASLSGFVAKQRPKSSCIEGLKMGFKTPSHSLVFSPRSASMASHSPQGG